MKFFFSLIAIILFAGSEFTFAWDLKTSDSRCNQSASLATSSFYFCLSEGYAIEWVDAESIVLKEKKRGVTISFYYSNYDPARTDTPHMIFIEKVTLRGEEVYKHQTDIDPTLIVYSWSIPILPNELFMVLTYTNEDELLRLFNKIFDSKHVYGKVGK